MSCNTYTLKTQIKSKTIYIRLQWNQNEVELFSLQILCDDGTGWSGTFSSELAHKQIEKLHQNKDDYYTNTKKCLTGEDSNYKLDFSTRDDQETAEFCWKKQFENLYQTQGALTLTKDNSVSEHTFIDFLIDENKALSTLVTERNKEIKEINVELAKHKSEFEKFADIKTSLETSLYGKFVQLLNTKKQRIRLLEEQLQKCAN